MFKVVIEGPRGVGKSHVLGMLRDRLEPELGRYFLNVLETIHLSDDANGEAPPASARAVVSTLLVGTTPPPPNAMLCRLYSVDNQAQVLEEVLTVLKVCVVRDREPIYEWVPKLLPRDVTAWVEEPGVEEKSAFKFDSVLFRDERSRGKGS